MSDALALLVFARPIADDAARKRLTSPARQNQRVFACLNQQVTKTATATGLPVLHSADLIQHRGSFGEQISGALQAVFDLGYGRVLVVGNDCPGLSPAVLLGAADALRDAPVVLGPDRRGGLYLLGLARDAFDQNQLAQLPWQTPALCRATRRAFADCTVTELPRLGDVNHLADLQAYHPADAGVGVFVGALLALLVQPVKPGFFPVRQWLMAVSGPGTNALRGPPVSRLYDLSAVV